MAQMRDDDPGMHVWINFYNSLMDSKICEKMITVSLEGEPSIPARIDAFRRVFEDCAGKGENALVTAAPVQVPRLYQARTSHMVRRALLRYDLLHLQVWPKPLFDLVCFLGGWGVARPVLLRRFAPSPGLAAPQ